MATGQKAAGSKFVKGPDDPNAPQESKLAAAFKAAGDRNRNIFYGANAQAVSEFHSLIGHDNNRGRLSKDERQLLADIKKEAAAEAKRYHLPLEVMESLLLAQKTTGVDHDAYMQRVLGPQALSAEVSDTVIKAGPIKVGLLPWLYLVKEHGREHGLGYFSDKISLSPGPNGTTSVDVADPAVLREISSLRSNPRIAAMMAAEQVKHQAEIPQLSYKGVNYQHDPEVEKIQRNLLTLGYDIGAKGADGYAGPLTIAAEKEFAKLSKPPVFSALALQQAADEAARNAADFNKRFKINITPDQAFAIRQASKVGGADFDLMMKLARRESNFNSEISAQTREAESKKAVGLFQFKPGTWLAMVKRYGPKYGLDELAGRIDAVRLRGGGTSYTVSDPWVRDHIMSLRKDPRISAMMGAEFINENNEVIRAALKREPNETEQYMGHFLGAGGAVDFLRQMKKNPDGSAVAAFPKQAENNTGVFYNRDGSPRTLREVYEHLAASFNTQSYAAGPPKPKPKPAAPHTHPRHH